MSSHAISHNPLGLLRIAAVLGSALLPLAAFAGSLRVGPTRIELAAQRPVAVLEVQNTGDSATLAQLDTFIWTQDGAEDLLEPTADLIATPLVINLAPGETRVVRVGLREPNRAPIERSYRLFVREVAPSFVVQGGLQFALRIGVPVFVLAGATRPGAVSAPAELSWRWVPDIHGCDAVQLVNRSRHYDRVIRAEMLASDGEVLWRSSEPAYVLAGSKRFLSPAVCAPSVKESATLRLTTDSRVVNLPVEAPSLVVDANLH